MRGLLDALAARVDAFAKWAAGVAVEALVWPAALAVALTSGVFFASHGHWRAALTANKLAAGPSLRMLTWTAAAGAALGLLHGAVLLVRRLLRGASGGLTTIAEVNRRLLSLLALPIVGALARPGIETESPKETFAFIALVALVAGAGAYAWIRPVPGAGAGVASPPEPRREKLARALTACTLAGLGLAYAGLFSWLSIVNHHAVKTRILDLGLYDNIFYQSSHGHPLACSFLKAGTHASAHFDPLLVLLSPLYLVHPGAETLLVLQSVWLGMGVVPLYLLACRTLGRRLPGVALAAMYLLHPALQGANMYEFHSLTLLVPIALWLLYFLETGALLGYTVALILALLCREDVSLLLFFVGASAVCTRKPRMVRTGWVTMVASLLYFVVAKRFFMTSPGIFMVGKDSYSYAFYYEGLIPNGDGVRGLVTSVLTNPVFVLRTVFSEAKVLYVLTLFVPLLFLPFAARPGRLMLLYGLLFCLLASNPIVYSPYFQYSSLILPIAFALVPLALRRIETGGTAARFRLDGGRLSRSLLLGAFVASLLASWKLGGIVENRAFRWGLMSRSLTEGERETYRWIRENVAGIPAQASVGATEMVGPHVSCREKAYIYPDRTDADYLFVHEGDLEASELDGLERSVRDGTFGLVSRREKMAFYRRSGPGPPPATPIDAEPPGRVMQPIASPSKPP